MKPVWPAYQTGLIGVPSGAARCAPTCAFGARVFSMHIFSPQHGYCLCHVRHCGLLSRNLNFSLTCVDSIQVIPMVLLPCATVLREFIFIFLAHFNLYSTQINICRSSPFDHASPPA